MNKKAKITLSLFLLSIVYMLFFMHPTIWRDESFTMALVSHNYGNIIRLDALDVHPPLYYILLKFFLNLTTFWTTSLFTKVIFARLFSYLLAIGTFVVLSKTVKNMGVPGGNAIQWAGFFLAPSVMRYSTQLRMYALAALLLALLFNQLQHYDNSHKVGHIFLSVLFASLASYTHYFAAIAAGWLLLLYFIKFQFNKYDGHTIIRAIEIFLIMFTPWGVVAFLQMNRISSNYWIPAVSWDTVRGNFINLFTDVFGSDTSQWYAIALIVIAIYPIIWAYRNMSAKFKSALTILLSVYVLTTISGIVISLLLRPIYIARYAYPIYSLLIFFIMVIVSNMSKKPMSHLSNTFSVSVLFSALVVIIGINVGFLGSNQFMNYDLPTASLASSVQNYQENTNQVINISSKQNVNTIVEKMVYIKYMNKQVKINNFNTGHVTGSDNKALFNGVFDNVIVHNK